MDQWAGVVLAAGHGERMKSRRPKVLHQVCGKEMLRYPVELVRQLGIDRILVVVSPGNSKAVRDLLGDDVDYVIQPQVLGTQALGTADALARAAPALRGQSEQLLVLGADSPLVRPDSVRRLIERHTSGSGDMTVLAAQSATGGDLGRVLRDEGGRVIDIVEAADGDHHPDSGAEVNAGVYCFGAAWLWENLEHVEPSTSGERYITSLASIGAILGAKVQAVASTEDSEVLGVNNRLQLAQVEAVQRRRICEEWMLKGVTIQDPASVFIDAGVTIGQDTVILPNTMLLGSSRIGEECEIGPGSIIRDSTIGHRCRVTASVLEEATMEEGVDIGPFSHLRPGAYLESGVHIGNFVEVKESRFAAGAVMGHFGYVGDAPIGADVNLGAGMVTCNYDGVDKHRTVIEKGAFIGCDTMLVAPVTVGAEAVTGAGSVVTKDVLEGRLAVGVPAKIRDRRTKTD